MLFIDLLKKVDIERVLFYLEKLGESKKSLDSYKTVYNNLLTMEVKDNKEMYIFVVEEKDYFEDEKYFNVLGLDIKDGESYAIEFMDWSDWLGSNVVEKSVDKFGSVIFVAECLKEMTFLGFEEERMAEEREELNRRVESIKSGEAEFLSSDEFFAKLSEELGEDFRIEEKDLTMTQEDKDKMEQIRLYNEKNRNDILENVMKLCKDKE